MALGLKLEGEGWDLAEIPSLEEHFAEPTFHEAVMPELYFKANS